MTPNHVKGDFGMAVLIAGNVWLVVLGLVMISPLEIGRNVRQGLFAALTGHDAPAAAANEAPPPTSPAPPAGSDPTPAGAEVPDEAVGPILADPTVPRISPSRPATDTPPPHRGPSRPTDVPVPRRLSDEERPVRGPIRPDEPPEKRERHTPGGRAGHGGAMSQGPASAAAGAALLIDARGRAATSARAPG